MRRLLRQLFRVTSTKLVQQKISKLLCLLNPKFNKVEIIDSETTVAPALFIPNPKLPNVLLYDEFTDHLLLRTTPTIAFDVKMIQISCNAIIGSVANFERRVEFRRI